MNEATHLYERDEIYKEIFEQAETFPQNLKINLS